MPFLSLYFQKCYFEITRTHFINSVWTVKRIKYLLGCTPSAVSDGHFPLIGPQYEVTESGSEIHFLHFPFKIKIHLFTAVSYNCHSSLLWMLKPFSILHASLHLNNIISAYQLKFSWSFQINKDMNEQFHLNVTAENWYTSTTGVKWWHSRLRSIMKLF